MKIMQVLLLIEIEESNMPPKKLLGDVFATLMCNRFVVKIEKEQKYFEISPKTQLIVAGVVSNKGNGQDKIRKTIKPRLQQFSVPNDTVRIDNIKFVFAANTPKLITELKREIKELFSIY